MALKRSKGPAGTLLVLELSISDEEQHLRFKTRMHDPMKQWKLSSMDLESRRLWEAYTKAKEAMLERTHIPEARLNCIAHLLSQVPYGVAPHTAVTLPERVHNPEYHRGPVPTEMYVPEVY